jgi:hypothetical protein
MLCGSSLIQNVSASSEQIFNHCTAVYQRYAALWRHLLPHGAVGPNVKIPPNLDLKFCEND